MRKTYDIAHLDCAVCAQKIEAELKQDKDVLNATYNLANKKLIIDTKEDVLIDPKKIQNILDRIEPGSKLVDIQPPLFETNRELYRLLTSLILFVIGLWSSNNLTLLVAYLIGGYPIFLKSFKNILRGDFFDENFLMVVASLGAIYINEYVEAVAVMLFYGFGEYLQDMAVERSRRNIQDLLDLDVEVAHVLVEHQIQDIAVEDVKIGDTLVIQVGEKVPVDGIIIKGSSLIDRSLLTGESLLEEVDVDSVVFAGTLNQSAPLTIIAQHLFEDSSLAKMKKVLDESALYQAEPEKFITKFSKVYTPVVLVLALLVAIVGPILVPSVSSSDWTYRALVFLVASCPCALVLSIPLSYFAGIGKASKSNILVKGGQVLDDLVFMKKAVFDKTGTLSAGVFEVDQVVADNPGELLQLAASLEQYSSHPLAQAILRANTLPLLPMDHPKEFAGRGISGQYNQQTIHLGSSWYMAQHQIDLPETIWHGSLMHLAIDGQYRGTIELKDQMRPTTKSTMQALNHQGITTYVLSGDQNTTVSEMAQAVGIDYAYGQLLPEDKVEKLKELKTQLSPKEKIMFVGDGINDSLVLQQADIGVAMGHQGADISIEVADMVLMKDDLSQILEAMTIAEKTRSIVLNNIILALVTKAIVLVLGALGYAPMLLAVFADVGVTLLAVLNSLRILR